MIDHHEVFKAGAKIYRGDTVYAWNAGAIGFVYIDMSGGTMKGQVRQTTDGLDFGASDYVGKTGRASPSPPVGFASATMSMRRATPRHSDAHNRTTRYTRID